MIVVSFFSDYVTNKSDLLQCYPLFHSKKKINLLLLMNKSEDIFLFSRSHETSRHYPLSAQQERGDLHTSRYARDIPGYSEGSQTQGNLQHYSGHFTRAYAYLPAMCEYTSH